MNDVTTPDDPTDTAETPAACGVSEKDCPVINTLKGAVIGIANIIPGVSGGTMALVLGIYDRLIAAVGRFGPSTLRDVARAARSPRRFEAFRDVARSHDAVFLATLGLGAILAIFATSALMKHLLEKAHDPTYAFFFGLVAASVIVPYSLLRRRSWREVASAVAAVAITVGITQMMSPEEKLDAARTKAAMRAAKEARADGVVTTAQAPTLATDDASDPAADPTLTRAAFFALVGAVAISAMILPGISGSFLLLLFGAYFDILRAVSEFDFVVIGSFAGGALVGLALFVRLLHFLLARWYSPTMAFLAGLMIGSLWNLWPFRRVETVGDQAFYLEPVLPTSFGTNEAWVLGAFIAGTAIALGFYALDRRRARQAA